jgi:hypothetical protein
LAPLGAAPGADLELKIEQLHSIIINFGRLHLVKGAFAKQMSVAYWAQEAGIEAVLDTTLGLLTAAAPLTLLPGSPLERVLRHMRHPKTRNAEPVELARIPKDNFELANAFEILVYTWPDELEYLRRPYTETDKAHRAILRRIRRTPVTVPKSAPVPRPSRLGAMPPVSPPAEPVSARSLYGDLKLRRPILHIPTQSNRAKTPTTRQRKPRTVFLAAPTDQHRFHMEGCPVLAGSNAQASSVQMTSLAGFCICIHRSKMDTEPVRSGHSKQR